MKELILISETILQDGIVPTDLLNVERFDLRSFQHPYEIVALAKVYPPKAVVLDLDAMQALQTDLRSVVEPLHAAIVFLGVGSAETLQTPQTYYQAGINDLLAKPFSAEQLQDKLQTLMGEKFRRFERKEIQYKFNLSRDNDNWVVTGLMINQECVVVEGETLPPVGANVFVTSTGFDPISLYLWAHCWRMVKNTLILRFLNPSAELLQKIEQLPAKPTVAAQMPAEVPKEKNDVDKIFEFGPIAADLILIRIKTLLQEKDPPSPWPLLLKDLSEFERACLAGSEPSQQEVAKAASLKIALLGQLVATQERDFTQNSLPAEIALSVLKAHEQQTKDTIQGLQKWIQEAVANQNSERVNQFNQLKSQLQRCILSFHKILRSNGILTPNTTVMQMPGQAPTTPGKPQARALPKEAAEAKPQKTAKKRSTKPGPTRKVIMAILLILFLGSAGYNFYRFKANQGTYQSLTVVEAQAISPFIANVFQFQKNGKTQFTIILNAEFDKLSETSRQSELKKLGEALNQRQISFAVIRSAKESEVALLSAGKMTVIKKPEKKTPDNITK